MARLCPHYYYILILCQFCKIYQDIICFLSKVSLIPFLSHLFISKIYIWWISLEVYLLDTQYCCIFPPIRFSVITYLLGAWDKLFHENTSNKSWYFPLAYMCIYMLQCVCILFTSHVLYICCGISIFKQYFQCILIIFSGESLRSYFSLIFLSMSYVFFSSEISIMALSWSLFCFLYIFSVQPSWTGLLTSGKTHLFFPIWNMQVIQEPIIPGY